MTGDSDRNHHDTHTHTHNHPIMSSDRIITNPSTIINNNNHGTHHTTTQAIAEAAHTTLSNALTTPTIDSIHDHTRVPISGSIVISDPARLASKRTAMIASGMHTLQIITDFDRTLSAFRTTTGAMCVASHNILESCVGFDETTFRPQMDAINTKYFALEISHDITEEERSRHMLDWWHQAHELLLAQRIHHATIEASVEKSRRDHTLELRQGARELLHLCDQHEIPCLVFSAGLLETINVTLKQENLWLPCMHLIGNRMYFDDTGLLVRFDDDTITSSNKNYAHVKTQLPDYHTRYGATRRNIICIGDNIGDANMSNGLDELDTIIRIGLLHDNVEGRLEQFKRAFDVVLLNDQDFSWTHELVKDIINGSKK